MFMKNLFLYIVTFFACSWISAQEKTIKIDWIDNQSVNLQGEYTEFPLSSNAGFNITESGVFQFMMTWKSDGVVYDSSNVIDVVYENIEAAKLINLNTSKIPKEVEFSVSETFARGLAYQNLTFNPLVNMDGVYKKVMSFVIKGGVNSSNSISNRQLKTFVGNEVSSSVLASGEWYKFKVDTTGVYKITPQFLSSIGMDLDGVAASTIKIYGNGGQALPLANDENEIFDVPENPIKIVGGEDGVFSGDDFILFYGRGTQGYVEENKSHINPYDDNAYYYVTSGGNASKKVSQMQESTSTPVQSFDSYDYYTFYEQDLFNLGQLGRIWHGDKFDSFQTQQDYRFNLPELAADSQIDFKIVFSAIYGLPPSLNARINNSSGVQLNDDEDEDPLSVTFDDLDTSNLAYGNTILSSDIESSLFSGGSLVVNLDYQRGADASSEGYLDYISVSAKANLKGVNKQFGFSNIETISLTGIGQYQIGNAGSISAVWDVTNPYSISEKSNAGSSQFNLNFELGSLRKFVVLDSSDYYEPTSVAESTVANQNLKGGVFQNQTGQFQDIDYLILTTNEFLSAATKLASFRTQNDGFVAKVVDIELIYNEFSTGKQDVGAIRNFVKYIYDNASTDEARLKYVCIIGDGTYDYKDRILNNIRHVPLYHAIESSRLPTSYTTDDFYCFMDSGEGSNPASDKMDISIGRILARDNAEANTMVDKTINYYKEEAYGDWRNSMLFVSDDVDRDTDDAIQEKIVEISDKLEAEVERVNVRRILTDSYVQEVTSGGERYDRAKRDLEDSFELGMSYINYFGHGGEDGITGEFIFSSESAQNLTNQQRLPVFVTLTCELTRFDNPNRLTAGEFLYWNPIGGAVALLSTTRNLFLSTGLNLNNSLADTLFDENNLSIPIGDATRLAKNTLSGDNKRTVFCIGDPALKVALPRPEVELTEVNGVSFDQWVADGNSLEALGRVNIKGKVVNGIGGNDLPSYNGQVTTTIFDKNVQRTTLGNDGTRGVDGEVVRIDFTESGSLVFKGLASVINGQFSLDLVLPKNVKFEQGDGKVSFYAENSQVLADQSGAQKITIGGLNENAIEDNSVPVINLFINDELFSQGQVVSSSPLLFAKLSDENGINTAGGVGHDIIAILDGDEVNPIVLNEYYRTNLDDFTSGQLTYRLTGLEPGEHTLSLRASDTYNNSSITEITFIVSESDDFSLSNVLNYPNPFVSYTEFWFTHNGISNDTLEVSVQVMTVTGKIVTTKFATLSGKNSYQSGLTWDGRDDFGNKIGKGVYVYKISVKSALTKKTTTKFQKLVVL